MLIWSKDGTPLYSDISNVPANAYSKLIPFLNLLYRNPRRTPTEADPSAPFVYTKIP